MDTYLKILDARKVLELPEQATMSEIKANYRKLIRQWHPDRCCKDQEQCKEMSTKIIAAYRIIVDFCDQYRFSFARDEVQKYLTDKEWWSDRFGDDPLWGHIRK
ncbi:MAG: J domain-containing protein [Desulfobulbaceae bacterium]|nr:J domain-containing protein [Desulfobulbaceae bacterium]